MSDLRLVIFDVDGTLVDSEGDILAAMAMAFGAVDLPVPSRPEVRGIVGLSLDVAIPMLAPSQSPSLHREIVEHYKSAYMTLRSQNGVAQSSPLYPGIRDMLERLQAMPDILMGVATGKSLRGLDKLLSGHDLGRFFVTRQVADHHPSKPHPSMILAALAETGIRSDRAVMVGDTSFDMEMARAGGVAGVGVSWGYHPVERLVEARHVLEDIAELPGVLDNIWQAAS